MKKDFKIFIFGDARELFLFLPKKAPKVIKRGYSKFIKKNLGLASLKLPNKKTYQILGRDSLKFVEKKSK